MLFVQVLSKVNSEYSSARILQKRAEEDRKVSYTNSVDSNTLMIKDTGEENLKSEKNMKEAAGSTKASSATTKGSHIEHILNT